VKGVCQFGYYAPMNSNRVFSDELTIIPEFSICDELLLCLPGSLAAKGELDMVG
jgi:hypothetical protein